MVDHSSLIYSATCRTKSAQTRCTISLGNMVASDKSECKLEVNSWIFSSLLIQLFLALCRGNTPETRGTAFVVYEDIFDAKNACDHLSGFNVCNRYLVVLYYQSNKAFKRVDVDKKQEELNNIKSKYNINSDDLRQ